MAKVARARIILASLLGLTLTCTHLTSGAIAAPNIRIAVLYDIGGRGDNGINDAAAKGVDAAKRQFHLSELDLREMAPLNTEADREARLLFLAKAGYNVVIAIGSGFSQAVATAAEQYPLIQFAIIGDSSVPVINVMNIDFSHHQSSFMAGVLAGATSRTGKVGDLLPNDSYLAIDQKSFADGVHFVNPKIKVISQVIIQPAGSATTLNISPMTSQGIDILYSRWSDSNQIFTQLLAFNNLLAKKKAKYSIKFIGATPQQYFLAFPNAKSLLLGAVQDRFDRAVVDLIAKTLKGETFNKIIDEKQGIYGQIYTFASGGVALATSTPTPALSAQLRRALSALNAGK